MFLGHYGIALASKRIAPEASLGTLVFAAQLADEVWPLLLLLGIERVRIAPGLLAASSFDFTHYPYTHSLLMQLLAGVLVGFVYCLVRRNGRAAVVAGALVPSHWLLDFLVHRPDLPLYPGGPRVGLGAWGSIPLTLLLEAVVFGAGLLVYLRSTTPRDRTGRLSLWVLVAVLVGIYASSMAGPPPAQVSSLAWSALTLWLFIPWSAWIDRHRAVQPSVRAADLQPR